MSSVTVRDVPAADFIAAYATFLQRQGKLEVPGWVELVKTGVHKELPPQDAEGWFYKRSASIARQVYLGRRTSVRSLSRNYGGSSNRGVKPSHHRNASGSVNRKALQALEALGVVEKDEEGRRRISQSGRRDLDRIAESVLDVDDEDDE